MIEQILKPKTSEEIQKGLKTVDTSSLFSLFKTTKDSNLDNVILNEVEKRNSLNESNGIYDEKIRFLRLMALAQNSRNEDKIIKEK